MVKSQWSIFTSLEKQVADKPFRIVCRRTCYWCPPNFTVDYTVMENPWISHCHNNIFRMIQTECTPEWWSYNSKLHVPVSQTSNSEQT